MKISPYPYTIGYANGKEEKVIGILKSFPINIGGFDYCLHIVIANILDLSTIWVFSACDMVTGNALSPFKAFSHFCCVKTISIFTFHNPKSLSPVNFSISHFELMVLDYRLILALQWAPIVVNSLKITPIKYLMCGAN